MQNNETSVEPGTSQPAETPEPNEFETVKTRLEEIARAVDDENLSLDDALDLYEEAVKLGLQASNLLEVGIVVEEGPAEELPGEAGDSNASNNVPDTVDAPAQA